MKGYRILHRAQKGISTTKRIKTREEKPPTQFLWVLRKEYPPQKGLRLELLTLYGQCGQSQKGISTTKRIKTRIEMLRAVLRHRSERNIHHKKD